jgi:hypothetical protein
VEHSKKRLTAKKSPDYWQACKANAQQRRNRERTQASIRTIAKFSKFVECQSSSSGIPKIHPSSPPCFEKTTRWKMEHRRTNVSPNSVFLRLFLPYVLSNLHQFLTQTVCQTIFNERSLPRLASFPWRTRLHVWKRRIHHIDDPTLFGDMTCHHFAHFIRTHLKTISEYFPYIRNEIVYCWKGDENISWSLPLFLFWAMIKLNIVQQSYNTVK